MAFIIIFILIPALFLYAIYKIAMGTLSFVIGEPKTQGINLSYEELQELHKGFGVRLENDVPEVRVYQPEVKKEMEIIHTKSYEFRPQTFTEFIGQEEAKKRAETIIKKVARGMKGHLFVNGIKGHGKTTYIEILAKQLNAKLISYIGRQVEEDTIPEIVEQINKCTEQNIMLFIDEMDTMESKVIKILNPMIEKFELNGKAIKPFVFAGATINKHELVKSNPDFLDRVQHHITFIKYNAQEVGKILTQYGVHLYPEDKIDANVVEVISNNCKYNPRTSISLLEDYIIEQDVKKVLNNSNIVAEGLTKIDMKILNILSQSKRAMGANIVAIKSGLSPDEYLTEYEPFLCEYDYINRIPSRVISDKGRLFIEKHKEII